MRTAGLTLVSALVVAGALAVLSIRRERRRWFRDGWADDDPETVEAQLVPMAAWPMGSYGTQTYTVRCSCTKGTGWPCLMHQVTAWN